MERRLFISTGCKWCIGVTLATLASSLLTSCHPLPIYNTNVSEQKLTVPLSQFAENNFLIVRCSNLDYDIAVVKQNDSGYRAIYMRCTHADNPVDFDGNEFKCNLHGSQFSQSGEVKKGPAEKPLVALRSQIDGEQLIIYTGN